MKLFKKKIQENTGDGFERPLPKKKTLKERLKLITYMELSLSLFALAFILVAVCIVLSAVKGGQAGLYVGLMGILAFLSAFAGIIITLYGHFIVKIEGKVKWMWGIILNGGVAAFLVIMYVIGAGA